MYDAVSGMPSAQGCTRRGRHVREILAENLMARTAWLAPRTICEKETPKEAPK